MSLLTSDFLEHAFNNGIEFDQEIIQDGQLHRVRVKGDKRSKKNGWYIYHDGLIPVCVYGTWKGEQKHIWSARHESEMNKKEQQELKRMMAEASRKARRQRKLEQTKAAVDAGAIYDAGADVVSHSYLSKKLIKSHDVLRLAADKSIIRGSERDVDVSGALVIPVVDRAYNLTSNQYIFDNGFKMFHPNGKIKGCFCPLYGDEMKEVIFVCEGFATGATIHEQMGNTVYVAFNCGNLREVARHVQSHYPNHLTVIAADDDWLTERPIKNPGMFHARQVANDLGLHVVKPIFDDKRKTEHTDFNDLHYVGATWSDDFLVRDCINKQLNELIGGQL